MYTQSETRTRNWKKEREKATLKGAYKSLKINFLRVVDILCTNSSEQNKNKELNSYAITSKQREREKKKRMK
jgi:hypothetical protein